MGACGMYNWVGEWLYRVGIPAKSGVAGGVLAVLPGQISIGVYSPRLDVQGNITRPAQQSSPVGERARNLFLLERGQASVFVDLANGDVKRLATFCSGMVFGELALLDDSPRSATVIADTPVTCAVLEVETLDALGVLEPAIKIQVLKNLALALSEKLRSANRALSALE